MLSRYAMRLTGNNDNDDILQDAFVELWHRHDDIADREYAKSFVYRCVYTRVLNDLKHQQVKKNYCKAVADMEANRLAALDPDKNNVLKQLHDAELGGKIHAAIDELPPKARQAFTLSYLHGMRNKDIAGEMEVSVRTVDAHIHSALKFLRTKLEKEVKTMKIFIFIYIILLSYY